MRHLLTSALLLAASLPAAATAQPCPTYTPKVEAGVVSAPAIEEASGLAASRRTPGVLWTHNDSGDSPRLFALSTAGELLGTWQIGGAEARDWEDLAAGPCPEDAGAPCLYIADFGNNSRQRDDLAIYVVEEPAVDLDASAPITTSVGPARRQPFTYPYDEGIADDNPDAEALLVDPLDGTIYVATKEDTRARLLRMPSPTWSGEPVALEHLAELRVGFVTAGDWRPDGARFAVRSYARIYEFDLPMGASLAEVFDEASRSLRISGELQGEALAYASDGAALYTVSEGQEQSLWRRDCEAPAAEDMGDGEADMASEADMAADAPMEPPPGGEDLGAEGTDDGNNSGSDGCSCGTLPHTPGGSPALLLIGLLASARRRRSRRHTTD